MMNFAGLEGFGSGLNDGLGIAAKIAAMQDAQRMQGARQAVGRTLAMPPTPQPPMPGQASMPPGGGAMSPDPMMGPQPMPQPGMDPGLMALPSGGAPLPPGPPQPMPMVAPGPATGAGGAPLSGTAAPGGDVVKDAQSTITAIAQQIKAANPDIAPEQLFDATQLQIEQMKGVRNDVKDYMSGQIELAKIQQRLQTAEMRLTGQLGVADIAADSRRDVAGVRADASLGVADRQAGARVKAAEIGGSSRRDVATTQAGARVEAAGIGGDSREAVAATGLEGKRYAADQGYRKGVNSAQTAMGKKPSVAPGTQPKAKFRAKGGYANAEAVRAAFQAGKIDQNQATSILKRDFGMQ